jgi:hypothetical protein
MPETFTDLRVAPVLTCVGDGPHRAAREWQRLGVRRELARFDPVVVSSLAAGLDADGSDLDVVCDLRQPGFVERAHAAYGTRPDFAAWTTNDRTLVRFFGEELQVELVGEARPVEAQSAYRHAVAQRRLVEIGGEALAARVRGLRRDFALKTEPALATALDLAGDPYESIARLACAPTAELERLVDKQFPLRGGAAWTVFRAPDG